MTLEKRVNKVKRLIAKDIKAGTIPVTVKTFSELHDYVDANEYLIEALPDLEVRLAEEDESGELRKSAFTDIANQVADAVDEWLKNGRN